MRGLEGHGVHYHPVIERFMTYPPLDAVSLMLFAVVFVATVAISQRRPAAGVAALAFMLPFAFYHEIAATTISFSKVVLAGVFVGLLPHWRETLRALRDARLVIAAFCAVVIALVASSAGARDEGAVLREVMKWIEYGVLFCVGYGAFSLDSDSRPIRIAFCASAALVCLSALAQEVLGSPSGIEFGAGVAPRIAGVLEGPNQLAGFLETATAIVVTWGVELSSAPLAWLAALLGATVMLTFSRGGMLGCALAVAIVAAVAKRRALGAALAWGSGLAFGAAADAAWAFAASHFAALRAQKPGVDYAGGVGHRAELWRAALFFFKRHPLVGIGAGNYETRLTEAGLYGVRTHANNWYLQALAEGGLVLFAAVIFLIAALIVPLLKKARRSPWALAALVATVALALHQLGDYLVFYPKVAEPWVLLCAIGLASRPDPCA